MIEQYWLIRTARPKGPVIDRVTERIQTRIGEEELEYLSFPALRECGLVEHLFTTRLGGVSEGIYRSMNLSYSRGDEAQRVTENYRRVARVLGCTLEDIVCSDQTHTTNIRRVTAADGGKRITKPADYHDIDGLVTNEPGVALATFYADCVPLYFVDTRNRAIGLAHSGWRGTVHKMGSCMCERMKAEFGTKPQHLLVAIGPSICQECYEVSEDVALAFSEALKGTEGILEEIRESGIYGSNLQVVADGRQPGKYQLDLWLANLIILREAGIPLRNISVTDVCTCHNPEILFSHRASQGKRGNLGAFLMLKKF
ncbi:MAG: peptidoglycan editing factor PgeF [Lachnospiraceae bacterium]|nr:peptidoglycan editing factor PgeF [Lachnospiraceae bacterium]